MALYLDTEFTGLDRDSELISLALVDDRGKALYMERLGLGVDTLDPWIVEHVLPILRTPLEADDRIPPMRCEALDCEYARGDSAELGGWLAAWLARRRERETVWVDMGAWDWFHFAGLFGGALHLPAAIEMYPIELSTWLRATGASFDLPRTTIAPRVGVEHHALDDARHLRDVVYRLGAKDGAG